MKRVIGRKVVETDPKKKLAEVVSRLKASQQAYQDLCRHNEALEEKLDFFKEEFTSMSNDLDTCQGINAKLREDNEKLRLALERKAIAQVQHPVSQKCQHHDNDNPTDTQSKLLLWLLAVASLVMVGMFIWVYLTKGIVP